MRDDAEFLTTLARLLGGAVDHQRAALDGAARSRSRRHRDGGAGAAACRRARLGRRLERNRRRPDADFRHLGPRLGDRARRSGAGPRRAQPPGFRAHERSRPQASPRGLPARRRNCGAGGAGSAGARALPRSRPGDHARAPDAQGRRRARHAGRDRMGARRCRLQAPAGAAAACRAGAGARRNLAQASGAQRPSRRHRLGLRPRRRGQLRMRTQPRRARAIFWLPASPVRR